MAFYHVYTGEDGQSHLEKLDLASRPELTQGQAATSIIFREAPAGRFSDWHPAPRRQYLIQLSGEVEVVLGDGTSVRYVPGDVRLVADTTGRGHTTRVVSEQPSITAVIPLAD